MAYNTTRVSDQITLGNLIRFSLSAVLLSLGYLLFFEDSDNESPVESLVVTDRTDRIDAISISSVQNASKLNLEKPKTRQIVKRKETLETAEQTLNDENSDDTTSVKNNEGLGGTEPSFINPFGKPVINPTVLSNMDRSTVIRNKAPVSNDTKKLAQDLMDAALDEDIDESPDPVYSEFTFSPLMGIHYVPYPAVLGVHDSVYAHLLPERNCTTCIVKWQHRESGEIHILAPDQLISKLPYTIFLTPENGWRQGEYTLSVFDTGSNSQLISRNSIIVIDVHTEPQTNVLNAEFIQSLIDDGKAVSKTH